jgi:NAD(P)-dependent dehydrogenase (short-subunit alcohol dehydrogenase family)
VNRLQGQIAWISGGTSGIGAAVARLFALEGASVTVAGRSKSSGRQVVDDILRQGGKALFSECDVSSAESVRHSIDETARAFGGLHIISNNAGMVQVKMLHDYTDEEWDFLMAVNVKSIYYSLKFGFTYLEKNQRSYIVNNGSISSFVGQACTPVYTASKGAVLQLTKSIALDYADRGIRCNCVCPGITDTPMLREHLNKTVDPEETLRQRLRRVPMGISLTPEDVAKSILYFSCEDSVGITGTSLIVDAGYLTAAEWNTEDFSRMRDKL